MPTTAFVEPEELARVLKIRTPSAEQTVALQRCIDTAMAEIIAEIDLVDPDALDLENLGLEDLHLALATEVNLERAIEHWKQEEAAFGILGIGADLVAVRAPRDSWERHALKLTPLKEQWGLA